MRTSLAGSAIAALILAASPATAAWEDNVPRGPTYGAVYAGNINGATAYTEVTFEVMGEAYVLNHDLEVYYGGGGYILMQSAVQLGGSTYYFHADLFNQGTLAGYGDLYGPGVNGQHVYVQFSGDLEQFTVTIDPFGNETTLYFTRIQ